MHHTKTYIFWTHIAKKWTPGPLHPTGSYIRTFFHLLFSFTKIGASVTDAAWSNTWSGSTLITRQTSNLVLRQREWSRLGRPSFSRCQTIWIQSILMSLGCGPSSNCLCQVPTSINHSESRVPDIILFECKAKRYATVTHTLTDSEDGT